MDSRGQNLVINQTHPSTLYETLASGQGFSVSTDGGKTWSFPAAPGGNGFAMDAIDGDVIYSGAIVFPGDTSGFTLWPSADSGQHWDRWHDRLPVPPTYLGSTPIFVSR